MDVRLSVGVTLGRSEFHVAALPKVVSAHTLCAAVRSGAPATSKSERVTATAKTRTRVRSGAEACRRVWGGWHYSAGFAQCSVIFATACSSESMATSSLDR